MRSLLLIALLTLSLQSAEARAPLAPEFTHIGSADWINSKPLRLRNLKGKPVLIEFWAYECVNCLRSIPWVKDVQERYADKGLIVVSVHTPELPQERSAANVRAAVEKFGITHPVMLDTDYSYWNAMQNRYWPAFYLIGPDGRIAADAIGEMHIDQKRAKEFELEIDAVLNRSN
jgi:thiol-disulfide isomerase/thioredoxin